MFLGWGFLRVVISKIKEVARNPVPGASQQSAVSSQQLDVPPLTTRVHTHTHTRTRMHTTYIKTPLLPYIKLRHFRAYEHSCVKMRNPIL